MARRKQLRQEPEITVWPSSLPEDIGSISPSDSGLSCEHEDMGSRFMHDAMDQSRSIHPQWDEEIEEPYFDREVGNELLRSMGLMKPRRGTTTRPVPHKTGRLPSMKQPRLPVDLEEFISPHSDEIDLTEESIHEASLLDHESEEEGEVESPILRTEDVHTHGKRRGGHARTSLRPPRMR